MQSSSTISVDNLQARAQAADDAAKQEFRNKVLSYANDFCFALKEASRLLGVSAGFLRKYAAAHKIEFADPEKRTKEEDKAIFKRYEDIRLSKEPKRVEPRKPFVQAGELKIPPQLDLQSKKAHWERQNKFLERVQELAETMTMKEVSKKVDVSLRFLKNFAYEHDIEFFGSKPRPANEALSPVFIAEEPPSPQAIYFLTRPAPKSLEIIQAEADAAIDQAAAEPEVPVVEVQAAPKQQVLELQTEKCEVQVIARPCAAQTAPRVIGKIPVPAALHDQSVQAPHPKHRRASIFSGIAHSEPRVLMRFSDSTNSSLFSPPANDVISDPASMRGGHLAAVLYPPPDLGIAPRSLLGRRTDLKPALVQSIGFHKLRAVDESGSDQVRRDSQGMRSLPRKPVLALVAKSRCTRPSSDPGLLWCELGRNGRKPPPGKARGLGGGLAVQLPRRSRIPPGSARRREPNTSPCTRAMGVMYGAAPELASMCV